MRKMTKPQKKRGIDESDEDEAVDKRLKSVLSSDDVASGDDAMLTDSEDEEVVSLQQPRAPPSKGSSSASKERLPPIAAPVTKPDVAQSRFWVKPNPVTLGGEVLSLRLKLRNYMYFRDWDVTQMKTLQPQTTELAGKDEQATAQALWKPMERRCQKFYDQKMEVRGNDVVVSETYAADMVMFPGSLRSASGCQNLSRPIRNVLLGQETAHLHLTHATPKLLRWTCKQLRVPTPCLDAFLADPASVVEAHMEHEREDNDYKSMERFTNVWTSNLGRLGKHGALFQRYEKEAKRVQTALMATKELQWIKAYLNTDNYHGSFVGRVCELAWAKLLKRVRELVDKERLAQVACLGKDVLYLQGIEVGDEVTQTNDFLQRCQEVCNDECDGLNAVWEWKTPDCEVRTKGTRRRVTEQLDKDNVHIKDGQLVIPDDYGRAQRAESDDDESGDEGHELDPEFELTYSEMFTKFSLSDDKQTRESLEPETRREQWGKVGSEFVQVIEEDGRRTVEFYSRKHFLCVHEDLVYYELKKKTKKNGEVINVKEQFSFLTKWLKDPKKDARYLRMEDKHKRCKWDKYDMHPDKTKCPDNVFNLWSGFAAERMALDVTDHASLDEQTQKHLGLLLGHVSMLCRNESKEHEKLILDLMAHLVQYPGEKPGILVNLVGNQGIGKGQLWEIMVRLVGDDASFETIEPERDILGDNNCRMRTAILVRFCEADPKTMRSLVHKLRNFVTDRTLRVRALYGTPQNILSYHRAWADSNRVDSIPDTDSERRFFNLLCNPEKRDDKAYWEALQVAIEDDKAIRALFLWLKARKDVKVRYSRSDLPDSELSRALKAGNRDLFEQFIIDELLDANKGTPTNEFTRDDLWDIFKKWRDKTGSSDKITQQILDRWFQQNKLVIANGKGFSSRRERQAMDGKGTQVTTWTFHLPEMRAHYKLDTPAADPAAVAAAARNGDAIPAAITP